ncbi:glycosyltransferase family 2 protein [Methylobacillus gramineus]|uniref:glycosyltransferase family 2 protein n=1 Tax=Methylobacillus gramineus TaxID=755169 RepID=UPI001D000047|nr:glycosyltransferase family 2 protein [Methylobacillus gramineus]MCB5183732.1 glycosyltransferase family 2 protein [Methylobacillus gramineus]
MSFQPCLLIPIYNHQSTIVSTVDKLAAYGLTIFIVDDGSDLATQQVLAKLASDQPLVKLYRLPVNAGKGAAVMHGMEHAYASGYSHALQIDADGQHDVADVPRFLEQGQLHPASVICGKPIYDDSVPKGRLYGRYLTHFWVWIETLSFQIADSMCGFRLYPLTATCKLINQSHIPRRMDFDIAIVVHLAWLGLGFINLPTRVIYPVGGLSHFRMWQDNLNISKTHTRLFFGMLKRLPCLLWRKLSSKKETSLHWSQLAERGTASGLGLVAACYRWLGKPLARLMLYPIVAYFFISNRRARTASLNYLRRIHAFQSNTGPQPAWNKAFHHMLSFARSALDKLGAWMGDTPPVTFPNQQEMDALLAAGKGAMLIGAHLGNLEMMRAIATLKNKTSVNAVVYTDHAQRFNRVLENANNSFCINLIQVSHFGADTAIMLKEKIDQGELIVIVGDRTPPAENGRTTSVDFLGMPAPFAQGPFILASLLECPVYLFFCLQQGKGYRIHFEHFADEIKLPRRERQQALQAYVQQYAQRLESYCLQAPLQWFNFYDFWATPAKKQIPTHLYQQEQP